MYLVNRERRRAGERGLKASAVAVVIISNEKRAEALSVGVDDFCFVIGWSWPAMTNRRDAGPLAWWMRLCPAGI